MIENTIFKDTKLVINSLSVSDKFKINYKKKLTKTEFEEIKQVVSNIMDEILSQPEVIFNISGVRQKSENMYAHSLNVCALSVLLALRLNLPKEKI